MGEGSFPVRGLEDDRLVGHATAAAPVWLWSADGTRVLWANAAGCAVFGGTAALTKRTFASGEPARAEVERLANSLPENGTPRLERLRRLTQGARLPSWRALVCACSRLGVGDKAAILMVATEPTGPELPLKERVRRLDLGGDAAVAMPDGTIMAT